MANANSLTTLNLHTTRFFNADLTSVGDHFLRGTTSLTRIQEEALESVTHIGDYFMSESGVAKFNTGKFKELKELGKGFLSRCSSLVYANVSGLNRVQVAQVTSAEADAAKTAAKQAHDFALSLYKQAWTSDIEAQDASMTAVQAENGALKQAAHSLASIQGTVAKGAKRAAAAAYPEGKIVLTRSEKEHMLATKEAAKARLMAAKDANATADAVNAAADRKVETAVKAHEKRKELEAIAKALTNAAEKGQFHNLGLLHDCPKLKERPSAIKGARALLEPLKTQLHVAYPGLTYEDDTCGC